MRTCRHCGTVNDVRSPGCTGCGAVFAIGLSAPTKPRHLCAHDGCTVVGTISDETGVNRIRYCFTHYRAPARELATCEPEHARAVISFCRELLSKRRRA